MTPADVMTVDDAPMPRSATRADAERIRIEQHGATGLFWLAGWMFTIGFLQLPFWKALLAVVVWPYYIGAHVSGLLT